jgi:ketosteroid isomerase-like protein
MTVRPLSIAFVLLSSVHAFAQQSQSPVACTATEQAVREVSHQLWAAFRSRDVVTWDKLVDDSYISTDDGGVRKGKQDLLAELRKPEGNIHTDTDEQPEDVRVVFTGGVAIVNQTKHWTDYDKKAGISWGATSRTTRVLTCKNGEWRLVAFHETDIPNKHRKPSPNDHLDDYAGHYRLVDSGDKGDIVIVRKGDRLSEFSESWDEEAFELFPGKYDTFFSREDGWVERFLRDKSGKVTGILYTQTDGEFEAKRVP